MLQTCAITLLILCSVMLPCEAWAQRQAAGGAPDALDAQLGALIDRWHAAAATADAETYFGLMDEDAVYIGTEAGERWTKSEFVEFGKPYFDRGQAWAFTSTSRHIYVSEDGTMAWFEELLNTWMGVCAGSGVLQKTDDGWKFKHYHLAVTVPNDLISEFIDLVKSGEADSPENKN